MGTIRRTYYYDVNTGYRVKTVKVSKRGETSITYDDYRDVEGIKFPYRVNEDEGEADPAAYGAGYKIEP